MKRLHTYSQHFLRNPSLVHELIKHTSIKKDDTVYDIGAGSGVISSVLAGLCQKVIAIEAEPQTAKVLLRNTESYDNITVIEGNFLDLKLPSTPYKIFANIPFHISSEIVNKITNDPNPPTDSYLIVQKQFANKLLTDHTGFSSQLGMIIGPRFTTHIRKQLKQTDFWPHPNVDTVLLEIKLRKQPLLPVEAVTKYNQFVEEGFTSPVGFAKLPLHLVSRDKSIKPSSLTLSQWILLFQATQ